MGGDHPGSEPTVPSLDKRLRLLSNEHRRGLLDALLDVERLSEADVPDEVVVEDADAEVAVVALYHVHLPMLANEGLVDWDRDEGVVRRGPAFDSVRPILEWLREQEDRLARPA